MSLLQMTLASAVALPKVGTPTFNPNGDTQTTSDTCSFSTVITTATSGCNIRWTSDGSTPTSSVGNLIAASSGTANFTTSVGNFNIRAIAYKSGMSDSVVAVSAAFSCQIL